MTKWEYAEHSTFVLNIILLSVWIVYTPLIIGALTLGGNCSILFSILIALLLMTLITFLWYLVIYNKRKKFIEIVRNCDYKTQGKVVLVKEMEHEISDVEGTGTTHYWSTHFVVEYIDINNECQSFTTPAVNNKLRKYKTEDNLICDVYVKGNDVIAQNFRNE